MLVIINREYPYPVPSFSTEILNKELQLGKLSYPVKSKAMDNAIYSVLQAYPLCKIDAVLQFRKQIFEALLPTVLRDMATSRSDILNVLLPLLFYFRPKKYYKFRYKEYFTSLTSSTVNDLRMTNEVVTWCFYVLLTVHPDVILVNNQIDAQFFVYVYLYSLHVSGTHVPITRRIIVSMQHLVYVTLCRLPSGMQEHMLLHTRR